MELENMSAIDNDIRELMNTESQPIEENVTEEVVADTTVADGGATEEVVVENNEPPKVHVEGLGEFTIDEIKEFRNGYLRQSDYTKKTQELARQREEAQDALEVFNYLRNNPHMVNALMEMDKSGNPQHVQNVQKVTPEATMMRQILHTQKAMEVEMKLNDLKHKYGDIDEVSVLSKANELKTDDLEFVYKALQYDAAIERQKTLEQQSVQNLKAEIDANKKAVSTIVGTNQSNVVKQTPTLTADEKRIASLMGISEGEYLKWKVK